MINDEMWCGDTGTKSDLVIILSKVTHVEIFQRHHTIIAINFYSGGKRDGILISGAPADDFLKQLQEYYDKKQVIMNICFQGSD